MTRFFLAFQCFFRILFSREFSLRVKELRQPPPEQAEEEPVAVEAVRVLALFQREGRLVDFLREDVTPYDDAQIGAAARSVHQGCSKVLDEYFEIVPVRDEQEEAAVTVEDGFDPSAIQLIGEVSGQPPYRGTLKHHGWRAARATLPPVPEGQDQTIVASAEIEIQ